MDEDPKEEGSRQPLEVHVEGGIYLGRLRKGDIIFFTAGGKLHRFFVEKPAGQNEKVIQPIRGTLRIVDPAKPEDAVEMADVGINGSLLKEDQLLPDVLDVGKCPNILLPNSVKGFFPDPITKMVVFLDTSHEERNSKELLREAKKPDAKSKL